MKKIMWCAECRCVYHTVVTAVPATECGAKGPLRYVCCGRLEEPDGEFGDALRAAYIVGGWQAVTQLVLDDGRAWTAAGLLYA